MRFAQIAARRSTRPRRKIRKSIRCASATSPSAPIFRRNDKCGPSRAFLGPGGIWTRFPAPTGNSSHEALHEVQRRIGHLAPPAVDGERVAAAFDLDELGDSFIVL